MQFLFKKIRVFGRELTVVVLLWFVLALAAAVAEIFRGATRNYMIFRGVFWHTLAQTNLFAEYPAEYLDTNHYGPSFSLVIAPFAIFPVWMGIVLWGLFNAWILQYAIRKLPFTEKQQLTVLAITLIEMMTAMHNLQFNIMLAAWLILAFILVEKEKDFWATLFIAAGFLVKLYGIGAILFFFFSKHKFRFAWSFIFWCVVLFCLPMLYSSPHFIVQSYHDWYDSLVEKNIKNSDFNLSGGMQDISVLGMIRRVSNYAVSNLYVLAPAALLILAPLLRYRQYRFRDYRLAYLAIVLISVVIFSTSAESSTYVIPMAGVGIWFIINRETRTKWSIALLVFALLLTSLSATDLFPHFIKVHYVRAYSLKALPCFIIWLWLVTDVMTKNYQKPQAATA